VRAVPVPFGAVLLDTFQPITSEMLDGLQGFTLPGTRTGITGFIRYPENMTLQELTRLLAAGYLVLPVGTSRPNGYIPSAAAGAQDATRELARLKLLGFLTGITLGCDLEGMGGTVQNTVDYANAQASTILDGGNYPMAYVGAGVPLNAAELYALSDVLYWHSLSNVPDVLVCDYAMLQGYPTQTFALAGGTVLTADVNFVYRDKKGRGPIAASQ